MKKLTVVGLFALVLCASAAFADPGRGASVQCYLWANNASSPINAPYSPSSLYSYNAVSRAGGNSVTRTGTGQYTVTCKGVGGGSLVAGGGSWGPGGHVQVTAYGSENANYCKVVSWATGGADFAVTVRCYSPGGALADSRFDLSFIW
jgi:hypothetical protein